MSIQSWSDPSYTLYRYTDNGQVFHTLTPRSPNRPITEESDLLRRIQEVFQEERTALPHISDTLTKAGFSLQKALAVAAFAAKVFSLHLESPLYVFQGVEDVPYDLLFCRTCIWLNRKVVIGQGSFKVAYGGVNAQTGSLKAFVAISLATSCLRTHAAKEEEMLLELEPLEVAPRLECSVVVIEPPKETPVLVMLLKRYFPLAASTFKHCASDFVLFVGNMLEKLHCLHEKGYVFGDVSLGNMMVTHDVRQGVFIDVEAVVKKGEDHVTKTCCYLPPEWWQDPKEDAHPMEDIWALGVALYALHIGREPNWFDQVGREEKFQDKSACYWNEVVRQEIAAVIQEEVELWKKEEQTQVGRFILSMLNEEGKRPATAKLLEDFRELTMPSSSRSALSEPSLNSPERV